MNFYNKIANILRKVENDKISFKNAIYNNLSENDKNFTKIYKIVIEILRLKDALNGIIETFFENIEIKDKQLFKTLLYENFFSDKKVKIGGKLMKAIKAKKQVVSEFINKNNLNTNRVETNDLMHFRVNKLSQVEPDLNFEDLNKDELDGLYYISKKSQNLYKVFELRDQSNIIIQTKSSFLPAYFLKNIVKQGIFDIIDSCSAPGNKTLQLSEYFMKSKVYAFEINDNRFEILQNNINIHNTLTTIQPIKMDFLTTDISDPKFKNVRIILADPSCSGSGTLNNSLDEKSMNECCLDIAGSEIEEKNISRLKKLSTFQIKILNHAMSFPSAKYISYSTCSVYMTENEYVVSKVLKTNPSFVLKNFEHNFHKGLTEETKNCARTCRKCHSIDGFFVAIFERINI
jgi:putative methyltransferase